MNKLHIQRLKIVSPDLDENDTCCYWFKHRFGAV